MKRVAHSSAPAFLFLVTMPVLIGAGACRGEPARGDPSLDLKLAISPTPPGVGPARIILLLTDTAGAPVEGASIRVEGNMAHAGMIPVVDTAEAVAPGRYAVPGFRFTMAGEWLLSARATLPDGRWTVGRLPTSVLAAPPGLPPDTGGTGALSQGEPGR
jgi:hypothetical protein